MLISGAVSYADHIMEEAQQTVTQTLETLNAGVAALQSKCQEDLNASMAKLAEARLALQNAANSSQSEQASK